MLSVVMETLGTVGTAAVISVISSWKFTLGYLAVVPVLVVTHALRLKTFRSRTKEEQKALEEAGQVRIYQVFKEQYWRARILRRSAHLRGQLKRKYCPKVGYWVEIKVTGAPNLLRVSVLDFNYYLCLSSCNTTKKYAKVKVKVTRDKCNDQRLLI